MNRRQVDTLAYRLKAAIDAAAIATPVFAEFGFYTYKTMERDLERIIAMRPFVAVLLPEQLPLIGFPRAAMTRVGYRDRTQVTIHVETPFAYKDDDELDPTKRLKGGYDAMLAPMADFVRAWIMDTHSLEYPAELGPAYEDLSFAMRPDDIPEAFSPLKDGERQLFFVTLSRYATAYNTPTS